MPSTITIARPSGSSRSISRRRPKALPLSADSMITMPIPAPTAERKNSTGSMLEYHSGWSFAGTIR